MSRTSERSQGDVEATGVEVVVVPTGTANLASVWAALQRAGAAPRLADHADEVRRAERVVLPGVGAFGAAMEALSRNGLADALRARIGDGRATLAICLGLQLFARSSEESPGVAGLGVVDVPVVGLRNAPRVPQLGWNAVIPSEGMRAVAAGHAYYANSFCIREAPAGWHAAITPYGTPFVAALARGDVVACQFHPELSGAWGQSLIHAWLHGGEPLSMTASEGLKARIIPCLDCRDGRVVKGVRFSGLRDAGDPGALAAAYEAQGADEIIVLDVSATPEGRATAHETVRRVRAQLGIPLTVGGGVRTADDAGRLLEAGADKVSVNTAAVERPALIADIARRFGSQCAVLALDAARTDGGWEVVVRSGTERTGRDAVAWAREAASHGAGEILLTSFDRDGTGHGYDLALLRAVAEAVRVPVIASGGAATPAHLREALHAGADAVLAASIFHDGVHTVDDVKRYLKGCGEAVRT